MGDTQAKTKRCSKCKEFKPAEEFNIDRRRKDGLQAYCKPCMSAMQKKKEYALHAPKPTPTGVQLAKKAIDVVEALPSNNYNIHKAYASVEGKELKRHVYEASNKLWDDLADNESALTLFRSYITNDVQNIDLQNSFTKYFMEAMQNGSLGEKNSALQLCFKVLGWLERKTEGNQKAMPKTPEQRRLEREKFLQELESKAN